MLIQAIDVPLNNIPVFGISSYHGFLPADDPLRELPGQFTAWEEVADALPILIIAGRLQRAIDYPLSMRCAMMLLSHLGNGYVWGEPQAASVIPKTLRFRRSTSRHSWGSRWSDRAFVPCSGDVFVAQPHDSL